MTTLYNTIYVTVGTTKFDELIDAVASDNILKVLISRGCQKLIIQYGNGHKVDANRISSVFGIEVEQYNFKFESQRFDIINSNLIIGHAGAGTCLDILKNGKPGIIVINDNLMNNHQEELAEQLATDGYIYFSSIKDLASNLRNLNFEELRPYIKGQGMSAFISFLSNMIEESNS